MHAQPGQIAAVLGLPHPSAVTFRGLADRCENGLPVESLDALVRTLAPSQPVFLRTLMTQSTLRRRQKRGTLSPEESDRLVRLATTWVLVFRMFGTEDKARQFLFAEHALLGGRKPVELAAMNLAGAQAVEQVLGRLRYGTAA